MRLNQLPTWAVDTIGLICVVSMIALAGWLGIWEGSEARAEASVARERVTAGQKILAAITSDRDSQEHLLAQHISALASLGVRKMQAAPEQYFQDLAALAAEQKLEVISQRQVADRDYPGLRERQYAYAISGSTLNIWRFLSSLEKMDAWADVSYLKLESGPSSIESDKASRLGALTISVFSVPDQVSPKEQAGGDRE